MPEMRYRRKTYQAVTAAACLLVVVAAGCASQGRKSPALALWYASPARAWTDALPLGNGRLGAMIFGGVSVDHIQFNEETFWTGGPRNYNRPGAKDYLGEIRRLLFEGNQKQATVLAGEHFMGLKNGEDTYDSLFARWMARVRTPAMLGPSAPGYPDSAWPRMKVPTPNGFERVVPSLEGENGAFWFRQRFRLPGPWKGKTLILHLGNIRDNDFTYVNGHLVGSMQGMGKLRRYPVRPSYLHPGENVIAIQVVNPDNKGGLAGNMKTHRPMRLTIATDSLDALPLDSVWRYYVQDDSPPPYPHYQASYQPFGDLWLQFPEAGAVTGYRRSLDISRALCTTAFTRDGVRYHRTYFVSAPAQALVVHLSADKPGKITFTVRMTSKHHASSIRKPDAHTLSMDLALKTGVLRARSVLRVRLHGGRVTGDSDRITVTDADSVTLYLAARTSFVNYKDVSGDPGAECARDLAGLDGLDYTQLKDAHVKDYQGYFNTFSVDLGHTASEGWPTDQRIDSFDNRPDPGLVALYMQYARYLLISSSRPGTQPPNLQGIWNDEMRPPWGSKFTTNINLEMNYWPAEVLNLSRCSEPLAAMMQDLTKTGHQTAEDYYGCPGWVLHHNTDLWRGTAPIDNPDHGIWVTGGAWLCHELWEHYRYTLDRTFLKDTAYPIMAASARFFNCFLVTDPVTGYLVSAPSNSPEHGGLVAGPTMDHQIIRALFKSCIRAANILHTDAAFADSLREKLSRIAPEHIGRYGQLQEWLTDIDDTSDHYRHVSHLWGVYPGEEITWDSTPKLMKAARQSLIYRGDEGTGWSLAWKINLWDRFGDGDHAYRLLKMMLSPAEAPGRKIRGGSYPDLLDAHPPYQIDGNFGGAAGVAGMFIRSEAGVITLLPALPAALAHGRVRGIRAEGDFTLDIIWQHGKLSGASVYSGSGGPCLLKYGTKLLRLSTTKGKTYVVDGDLALK